MSLLETVVGYKLRNKMLSWSIDNTNFVQQNSSFGPFKYNILSLIPN